MIQANSFDELHLQDSWLTIGVFDGVHRGHQQIIRRLVQGAHDAGSRAVVMTFWPHPATVLGNRDFKCLTTPEERVQLLSQLNVDITIVQTFDETLAKTPAADFVRALKEHLGLQRLLIGYDFALGRGREGDAARLKAMGQDVGYEVEVIPALGDESGVISSTEIRKLVATGNVADAGALLGHCYELHGSVVHGDSRGRQLGFPTANIEYVPGKILPANGVYACRAWLGDRSYMAATNVGIRPQFHEKASKPLVEAYLLDFNQEIYGQDIRVEFMARLRDEQRFSSVEALIAQMHRDVQKAHDILSV
jgi:riboflavin kinase / FMN adenylyltransferase